MRSKNYFCSFSLFVLLVYSSIIAIDIIRNKIKSGLPVFGTCAGLLLLAKQVKNHTNSYLQTMNITAIKNAYGRQLGSFKAEGIFNGINNIPFVFIRAPFIAEIGSNVETLSIHDNKIVAARENNQLVTAFHPELTSNLTVHKYFIDICEEYLKR